MKLTIDTQADNHEDIRKAIKLLMSLVGDKPVYSNETTEQPQTIDPAVGNFMNLFDTPVQTTEKKEEKKEEGIPQLEFY